MPSMLSVLRGRLVPAVPVPMTQAGEIHQTALERYAGWMAAQPIGGVAVWAHTGRGLRLTEVQRVQVLETWRRALPDACTLIAAAGAPVAARSPEAVMSAACAMAKSARDEGADAILVYPPLGFRDRPDRDALIVEYHARIAEAGLAVVLFYLYEAAGGISYSPELLAKLVAQPGVAGIKIATLDSVMTFQNIVRLVKSQSHETTIFTGEDRFFGYSLMAGAHSALVGIGAACSALSAELRASFFAGRADCFLATSARVDELAEQTFVAPLEGYIERMLWCLVHEQIIPAEAAFDPWGPRLEPGEFQRLGAFLARRSDAEPVAPAG
jgi:4-hydroxy-tetrahydrodipicolinate synthase